MHRKPCLICRTTVSTPAKFLLQCSCGIGLHHNCIVPAIRKRTLMSMIEASTNDYHANSLESWQCPGCNANETNVEQVQPPIKKSSQLHSRKKLDPPVSSSRLRPIKPPKGVPLKQRAKALDGRPLVNSISVDKQSARVSSSVQADDKLSVPSRSPRPLLITPSHMSNNHPPQPDNRTDLPTKCVEAETTDSAAQHTPVNSLLETKYISEQPSKDILHKEVTNQPQPEDTRKSLDLPAVEDNDNINLTIDPPPEKSQEDPPPPLLDLRKFLKRKRCNSHKKFPKHFLSNQDKLPIYGPVEPPVKKRRLNYHEPESRKATQSEPQPQSKDQGPVIDSSSESLAQESARLPRPLLRHIQTPSSIPIPSINQAVKYDSHQHAQTLSLISNSETMGPDPPKASNAHSLSSDVPLRPLQEPPPGTIIAKRRRSVRERAASVINVPQQNNASTSEMSFSPATEVSPTNGPTEPGSTEVAPQERLSLQADVDHGVLQGPGADRVSNKAKENDIQNVPPLMPESSCDSSKKTGETSFADGLLSPPLTDADDENGHIDLDSTDSTGHALFCSESNGHGNPKRVSDVANQNDTDKASTMEQGHSENGKTEKTGTLTELDIIIQRLPRPRFRPPSFELPETTLPVLAQYFAPFRTLRQRQHSSFMFRW